MLNWTPKICVRHISKASPRVLLLHINKIMNPGDAPYRPLSKNPNKVLICTLGYGKCCNLLSLTQRSDCNDGSLLRVHPPLAIVNHVQITMLMSLCILILSLIPLRSTFLFLISIFNVSLACTLAL